MLKVILEFTENYENIYDWWDKSACQINSSILKVKHNENSENRNAVRLVEL